MDYLYGKKPEEPTKDIKKEIEEDRNINKKMECDITEA